MSPIWGRLADRYGRKSVLVRASLGLSIAMPLIGLSQNIYELVALRVLAGLIGGYAAGAIVLVATQTPKDRTGWALGLLSTGVMAGNLIGPLIGDLLPHVIGIRAIFFGAGAELFVAFLLTAFCITETPTKPKADVQKHGQSSWSLVPNPPIIVAMVSTTLIFIIGNISIEPIITIYVQQLGTPGSRIEMVAGIVMASSALASIAAAPRIGYLADRVGHWNVIIVSLFLASALLIPQEFITSSWQLIGLRFLMGLVLAGILPCVSAMIRINVPDEIAGGILGYSTSAQFMGLVLGPMLGGIVGGHMGIRSVFFFTSSLMLFAASLNLIVKLRYSTRSLET